MNITFSVYLYLLFLDHLVYFLLHLAVPYTSRPLLLSKPHFMTWRPSFSGVGVDLIAIFLPATDKVAPRFEPRTAEWEAQTLPLCQAPILWQPSSVSFQFFGFLLNISSIECVRSN